MTQPFSFFEEWRGAIFNTIFTALCVVELFFYTGRRLGGVFFETAIGGSRVRAKRVWRAQRVCEAGARSVNWPLRPPRARPQLMAGIRVRCAIHAHSVSAKQGRDL